MAHYPVDEGVPVGIECTDDSLAKIDEWMESGIASFDRDKMMVVKCAAQNYVFTTEQAAALIGKLTWDDNKVDLVKMFENRLLNPEEADPLKAMADGDEDIETAIDEVLGSCTVAEIRDLADVYDGGGERDDEEVGRFILDVKDAWSGERIDCVDKELEIAPESPFSYEQISRVLDEFTWSDEAVQVLEKFCGHGMMLPMLCEQMAELLDKYMGSDDKLKMLTALKPLIQDAENKALLVAHFEFDSDKEQAEEILRDALVHFKPLNPPRQQVYDTLHSIGRFVPGFPWYLVDGGWRCAPGLLFFVAFDEIDVKMSELGLTMEEPEIEIEHREIDIEHREIEIEHQEIPMMEESSLVRQAREEHEARVAEVEAEMDAEHEDFGFFG
jgi:hypothetical protein